MCLNVFGDLENKLKLKDVVTFLNKHDIILLNETWANDNSCIELEGYSKVGPPVIIGYPQKY